MWKYWALGGLFVHSVTSQCFELPILAITTKMEFPTEECHLHQVLPGKNCMKRPLQAIIEVWNRMDSSGLHCLTSNSSEKYIDTLVRYRGDSSLNLQQKHQFGFKFQDMVSFMGFPTEREWSLHGPYLDSSFMRNHLAHFLFRNTGRYSPRTKHVVLYLNGKYHGIYLVLEKITFTRHRVALSPNSDACNDTEISGGWAWQYNPLSFGDYSPNLEIDDAFNLFGMGQRPILEYPRPTQLSARMRNYFVASEGILSSYYHYLYSNMTVPNDLEKHIDIGSFVDYILHTEMSLNQDAYKRSVWFFKDRNQPINAGPVWDFNLAYGMGAEKATQAWLMDKFTSWARLKANYKVAGLLIKRWQFLRKGPWADKVIEGFVLNAAKPIQSMLSRCQNDWKSNSTYCGLVSPVVAGSYTDQLQLLLQSVKNRSQWMDNNILSVYAYLNSTKYGAGGPLPDTNCAADGNDNGCLANPLSYADAVSFPTVRVPSPAKPCGLESEEGDAGCGIVRMENMPMDPCWLSVGTYISASYLTPFCSGYGSCPAGANATCACNNKATTRNCVIQESLSFDSSSHVFGLVVIVCCCVAIFIGTVLLRHKSRSSSPEQRPLLPRQDPPVSPPVESIDVQTGN